MMKPLLSGAVLFAVLVTPALAAPPFKELDTDHDGTISRQEAEAWRPLTKVFDRLDKNCDGKLQEIEYNYLLTGKKAPATCEDKTAPVVKIK